MKISEKIRAAEKEQRLWWSFEYFPPKTATGLSNLYDRIERMTKLGPLFIDITWGAGGTTSALTTQFVRNAHEHLGLETNMHLTCTNMQKGMVDAALKDAYDSGCQNILALRGDPPKGHSEWTATEGGFEHAIDLIRFIRQHYGDYFDIAVAGFPEGHHQASDRAEEIRYLKEKIDAGATFIITQMFYDVDLFLNWVKDVRAAGIDVPIVPGIMPIQGYAGFQKTTGFSKTIVPKAFLDELEPNKDDDAKVREIGTRLVAEMCRKILNAGLGIYGLHFYTMNLEKSTKMILEELNTVPLVEDVSPLPWRPALTQKRRSENIRPIFWANRAKSYLSRTQDWDEFPNGRWGDSRSPAYGELDGYGIGLKLENDEALNLWGQPRSVDDISRVFASFCRGEVSALPWSDGPTAKETGTISDELAKINELGFWTINSQPAVDGVKSSDPVHGWGPRNGYVYQKAYLEFFTSPRALDALLLELGKDPSMTYYAVNKAGDLRTNTTPANDGPNAVTWGVYPGKEIIQPTIVEGVSFMAWKDEAFELGHKWADLYDKDAEVSKVIKETFDSLYLVNIVHNDYRHPDRNAIFKPFHAVAASLGLKPAAGSAKVNGHTNGVNGGSATAAVTDTLKSGVDGATAALKTLAGLGAGAQSPAPASAA